MSEDELWTALETLKSLAGPKVRGYGASTIPSVIDDEISSVIGSYLRLDEKSKQKIRDAVLPAHKFVLLGFAERIASLAVRSNARGLLKMAMVAMYLQAGIGDSKEDIAILTLVHAAAKKIGIDPRRVFEESASDFGLNETSALEAFLRRSDEDKSIVSMGYTEGTDTNGFRFIRTW